MSASDFPVPRPGRQTWLLIFAELTLIIGCVLYVTHEVLNLSAEKRIAGFEYSYLINSGTLASVVYRQTGAIPLWNPFIGRGEPLLENPFSFVLNPVMTLPMLWLGAINGAKIAVTLHALIAGIGGWLLGYVLNLRSPGRILLGLILSATGSMPALLYDGFFQMGLSQAYVPAIYAGLIGTVYSKRRWAIGLLAVATTLMLFAGTYWYVMPTAVGCLLLVIFGVVRWSKWRLDFGALRRLCIAVLWIAALSAVRLIPQIAHHHLVDHPVNWLNSGYVADFWEISTLYFVPIVKDNNSGYFHYVFPAVFAIVVTVGRLFIFLFARHNPGTLKGSWRVVVPGLVMIVLFTAWGQEATPFNIWLYDTIPFLRQWRYLMRIMAAAAVWIGIVGAIWFDDIVGVVHCTLLHNSGRKRETTMDEPHSSWLTGQALAETPGRNGLLNVGVVARWGVLAVLALVGGMAGFDVTRNWERKFGFWDTSDVEKAMVYFLRRTHPTEMLMVNTNGFFGYLAFYDTLVRAHFGNPDYRPLAMPATIGADFNTMYPAEYAVSVDGSWIGFWQNELGYKEIPGAPRTAPEIPSLFHNDAAPTYAYTVSPERMDGTNDAPLTRAETVPVTTYTHHIDSIRFTLVNDIPGNILVATELAYPGWKVTIDGQPATLESVGGLIGVRLPVSQPDKPLQVTFSYEPPLLYASALITLASVPLFALYVLPSSSRRPAQTYVMSILNSADNAIQMTTPPIQNGEPQRAAVNGMLESAREGSKTPLYKSPIFVSLLVSTLTVALTYVLVINRMNGKNGE